MEEHDLLELCRHAVTAGERMGATAVEALARSASEVGANIEQGQVSAINRRVADNIAIRTFISRRMGSAFTNIATRKAVEEALNLALSSARATTEDKDWMALPESKDYPEINGLWNDALAAAGGEAIVKLRIAEAIQGKRIILLPVSEGGMNLKTTDINRLIETLGVKSLSGGQ